MKIGEPHAGLGERIDVGRLDNFLAIAAELAIAEIVGHDQHDIRVLSGGGLSIMSRAQNRKNYQGHEEHKVYKNSSTGQIF